jgi:DNA-binding MarR family transcriptional regulator
LRHLADDEPASATRLSRRLGLPVSTVSEELRRLRTKGLIEETGALERRFTATREGRRLAEENWRALAPARKGQMVHAFFRGLLARVAAASRWNASDFSADSVWVSTVHALDDQGWQALAALHRSFVAESERIVAESARRSAVGGYEARLRACSASIFFEMPIEEESQKSARAK